MEYTHAAHTFGPVYDTHSRFLILGSFPSVKSREINFYYGHPQNRFWNVLRTLLAPDAQLTTTDDKRDFLRLHRIALWDVIASCEILGSSDSSIQNVVPNDISRILAAAPIQAILCNGGKSYDLFQKYCSTEKPAAYGASSAPMPPVYKLPSTSPANAAWSLERLAGAWGKVLCV